MKKVDVVCANCRKEDVVKFDGITAEIVQCNTKGPKFGHVIIENKQTGSQQSIVCLRCGRVDYLRVLNNVQSG